MYDTVLERFPLCIFGEFYRSFKYVRNVPRSTHMFICWRARSKAWEKDESTSQIKSSKKDSSI